MKFLLLFVVKPKAGFAIWKQSAINLQQIQLAVSGFFKPAMIFCLRKYLFSLTKQEIQWDLFD